MEIKRVSYDQHIITIDNNGEEITLKFQKYIDDNQAVCSDCFFAIHDLDCSKAPCSGDFTSSINTNRKDKAHGYFIKKEQ